MKKTLTKETIENIKIQASTELPQDIGRNLFDAADMIFNFQEGENQGFDLRRLFRIQEALNDLIFFKQDITATDGTLLSIQKLQTLAKTRPASANSDSVKWIHNFIKAAREEIQELEDSIPWKWWSKDRADTQNANVEIADILFFWICIAQAAGLTAEDVYSLYHQKAIVNINRQFGGYSKENKTEDDNRSIGVGA